MNDYFTLNLIWGLFCLFGFIFSLSLNLVGAPGNWLMLIIALIYYVLMPADSPYAFGLLILSMVLLFAVVGELLEFFTGAISTKKAGGSRRGMWFSIIGSVFGSFTGVLVGIPIPIIGSFIGALLFSGMGALLGAYYGELLEGKNSREAWEVGLSSFVGRVLGSLFKIICGLAALICLAIAMVV